MRLSGLFTIAKRQRKALSLSVIAGLMLILATGRAEAGGTTFGPPQVITTSGEDLTFAADLDGDGDQDLLSTATFDDTIAWYENTDGMGSFGPRQVITTSARFVRYVSAADLDGDGDLDVLSSQNLGSDDVPVWYENTDGLGSFGPPRVTTTSTFLSESLIAVDLDGDGDQDLLTSTVWHENTDGMGTFGPQQVIPNSGPIQFAADLDGDGDQDVLSKNFTTGRIAWHENTDGKGTFGPQQVITTSAAGARWASAADLDGDGDQDVLSSSASDDKIAWYENTDGLGTFGPQQVITSLGGGSSVIGADLDSDGDQDVLSFSWHENTDGMGTFGPGQAITASAGEFRSIFVADLDGDGDLDVFYASAWYENLTPRLNAVLNWEFYE